MLHCMAVGNWDKLCDFLHTCKVRCLELNLIGEINNSVLMLARMTKDGTEIDRIRKMGKVTTQVVGLVADYITSHQVRDGVMVKKDGDPLTIGEVKQRIKLVVSRAWSGESGGYNFRHRA